MANELEQYLGQLSKAAGFTLEELESNRQGRLHPTQVARVQRQGRFWPSFAFVFATLVLLGGLTGAGLYYDDCRKPLARLDRNAVVMIIGATAVVSGLLFVSAGFTLRRHRRRTQSYLTGTVRRIQGVVQKRAVVGRNNQQYWLELDGNRVHLNRTAWKLVTDATTYRAYLVGPELVSLEPVMK